ncbi:MAG: hypothetical protein AAF135_11135 [Bacteroidota bacterium]
MKSLVFFISLLTLSSALFAQNNLFVPFGQSKEEVKRYLYTRDYVRQITEDNELRIVRASLGKYKQVEYAFKENNLYATTVSRHYLDRQDAKEVQRNVLDYMDFTSRGTLKQESEEKLTVYTAMTDTRVIKFVIQQTQTPGVTLVLTSYSRSHSEAGADQDYYDQRLMSQLSKAFISN